MYDELLMERLALKTQIGLCMVYAMKETDKDRKQETLTVMADLNRRVEKINCKLAHKQLIDILRRRD